MPAGRGRFAGPGTIFPGQPGNPIARPHSISGHGIAWIRSRRSKAWSPLPDECQMPAKCGEFQPVAVFPRAARPAHGFNSKSEMERAKMPPGKWHRVAVVAILCHMHFLTGQASCLGSMHFLSPFHSMAMARHDASKPASPALRLGIRLVCFHFSILMFKMP